MSVLTENKNKEKIVKILEKRLTDELLAGREADLRKGAISNQKDLIKILIRIFHPILGGIKNCKNCVIVKVGMTCRDEVLLIASSEALVIPRVQDDRSILVLK